MLTSPAARTTTFGITACIYGNNPRVTIEYHGTLGCAIEDSRGEKAQLVTVRRTISEHPMKVRCLINIAKDSASCSYTDWRIGRLIALTCVLIVTLVFSQDISPLFIASRGTNIRYAVDRVPEKA